MTRGRQSFGDLPQPRRVDGAHRFADRSCVGITAFASQLEAAAGRTRGVPEPSVVSKWPARSMSLSSVAAAAAEDVEIQELLDREAAEHAAAGSAANGSEAGVQAEDERAQREGEARLRAASAERRIRPADGAAVVRPHDRMITAVDVPVVPDSRARPGKSLELPGELKDFSRWVVRLGLSLLRAVLAGARFAASSVSTYIVHHPVHFVFNVGLAVAMLVLLATGAALNDELISLKLTDRTATEIASASRFTRNYSLTEIEKRGAREFLRVGGPDWIQHESIKAIIEGSREAGLSLEHQAVLLATAEIESGYNPMARAVTTTACGIFQFIKSTGATFGLKNSDCLDPWKSTRAQIAHYRQNYEKRIEERVAEVKGPEKLLKMFELSYYLHHDGPLSKDPSDELKAKVLAGTPFLFKIHEVLKADDELRGLEPTFIDRFKERFDVVIARAKVVPGRVLGPVKAWVRPPRIGAAVEGVVPADGDAAAAVYGEPAETGQAATAAPQ